MNKFRLLIVTGLLTTALTLHAAPQQNQNRQGADVEKRVAQMQQRLNLSSDQAGRIRSILQTENDKIRDLRSHNQNGSTDRSAATKEMQQIRQDSAKQIESVLTPEQLDKYHQQRNNQTTKGRGRNKTPQNE